MKITVKSKEDVKEKISVNDLKPGTVFRFNDNVVSLKLLGSNVVFLNYWGEEFILSDGSMHYKNIEILGRLDEIIVVEE